MATIPRTDDRTYDLISIAYHALQSADTIERYATDAEGRGDQEAADFFRDVGKKQDEIAERAKQLLQSRLGDA